MEIIKAILYVLKNKKKVLRNLFLLLSCIFILNYVYQDRIYISDIKLAHNSKDGSSNSSSLSNIVSSFSGGNVRSIGSSTTNFDMIPEVVYSRSFLNKILEKKFYYQGESKKLYLIYSNEKSSENPNIPLLKLNGRKKLSKKISVSKNLNNPVIGISISANDKQLSFEIATAVLEQLKKDLTSFQLERIEKEISVIKSQVKASSVELSALEENLKNFRVNNSNISQSPSLRMEESRQLRDILAVSNAYSSLKAQLELTKIEYFEEANVLQIIDSPNLPLKKSGPRLRYMLLSLIVNFSLITCLYVYLILFLKSDLGKNILQVVSSKRDID
tara:strand:- start:448 stop:1437 length:990 start_codon:yes stop_codon:yes gene_type:complete